MRRFILALILWLLAILPTSADGPYYFPIIYGNPCYEVASMSDFKVTVPAATTNKALNGSFETTGNFAAEAGTTVTRVTAFQHYGLYSARVETNANNEGIEITLSALANAIHYVTVRVRGTLPATWDWSLNDSTFTSPTLLETLDGDWKLYGLQFPAAQANGSVKLSIHQNGTGSGDFYLDGIQVEENTTWTTYCDGTQPGCEWNGAPNASTSSRSAASRAGGIVYDLEDDYGFNISGMSGTGTSPQELFVDSYSQLPGGELNAIKTNSRVITLTGLITGTTQADFHAKKQALKSILAKDSVPQDQNGFQPVRLRYTGATVHKEIAVHYEGGLEANITADDPCGWEVVAIRFIAPNPYWYEIGESAALLDTNDSASTFRLVAARLRSTGQWSSLGPPGAGGTYTGILAIVEDATYVYFAGNFTNFDGIAAADRFVRYNKQTGAYTAIDAGFNGVVWDMALAPNGDLYIVGSFTNASGVAAADGIARLPAGGSAFVAVGTPTATTEIRVVIYASNNKVYIGGDFLNFAGIANADYIVAWDVATSAYEAVGAGQDGIVNALLYDNGLLYAGGEFTNKIEVYDTSTGLWSDVGGGLDNTVNTLALGLDGLLYMGGAFEGGLTVYASGLARIAVWDGTSLQPLGSGTDSIITDLAVGPDGTLFLVGVFVEAGGIATPSGIARWNGYTYALFDIILPLPPGDKYFRVVYPSQYVDPVVKQNYTIYLGHDEVATGTTSFGGLVTATNGGTVPAFPKIYFNRSGGTAATIHTLKNETNGQEILFNYSLLDGETLAVDLASPKKTITSSFFAGSRQDAALANSDLGEWQLLSGSNRVTSFVSTSGSPTVTAWALWKDQFDSQD